MALSWQGFVILNLGALLTLAYWLGKQKSTLEQAGRDIRELKTRLDGADSQKVAVAELAITVARLADEFAELRKSVFVSAMRMKDGG